MESANHRKQHFRHNRGNWKPVTPPLRQENGATKYEPNTTDAAANTPPASITSSEVDSKTMPQATGTAGGAVILRFPAESARDTSEDGGSQVNALPSSRSGTPGGVEDEPIVPAEDEVLDVGSTTAALIMQTPAGSLLNMAVEEKKEEEKEEVAIAQAALQEEPASITDAITTRVAAVTEDMAVVSSPRDLGGRKLEEVRAQKQAILSRHRRKLKEAAPEAVPPSDMAMEASEALQDKYRADAKLQELLASYLEEVQRDSRATRRSLADAVIKRRQTIKRRHKKVLEQLDAVEKAGVYKQLFAGDPELQKLLEGLVGEIGEAYRGEVGELKQPVVAAALRGVASGSQDEKGEKKKRNEDEEDEVGMNEGNEEEEEEEEKKKKGKGLALRVPKNSAFDDQQPSTLKQVLPETLEARGKVLADEIAQRKQWLQENGGPQGGEATSAGAGESRQTEASADPELRGMIDRYTAVKKYYEALVGAELHTTRDKKGRGVGAVKKERRARAEAIQKKQRAKMVDLPGAGAGKFAKTKADRKNQMRLVEFKQHLESARKEGASPLYPALRFPRLTSRRRHALYAMCDCLGLAHEKVPLGAPPTYVPDTKESSSSRKKQQQQQQQQQQQGKPPFEPLSGGLLLKPLDAPAHVRLLEATTEAGLNSELPMAASRLLAKGPRDAHGNGGGSGGGGGGSFPLLLNPDSDGHVSRTISRTSSSASLASRSGPSDLSDEADVIVFARDETRRWNTFHAMVSSSQTAFKGWVEQIAGDQETQGSEVGGAKATKATAGRNSMPRAVVRPLLILANLPPGVLKRWLLVAWMIKWRVLVFCLSIDVWILKPWLSKSLLVEDIVALISRAAALVWRLGLVTSVVGLVCALVHVGVTEAKQYSDNSPLKQVVHGSLDALPLARPTAVFLTVLVSISKMMGLHDHLEPVLERLQSDAEDKEWRDNPHKDDVNILCVDLEWNDDGGGDAKDQFQRPTLTWRHLQTLSLTRDFTELARKVITGEREDVVPEFGVARLSAQDLRAEGRNLLLILGARDHKELQPIIHAITEPCRQGKLAELHGLRVIHKEVVFSVVTGDLPPPLNDKACRVLLMSKANLTKLHRWRSKQKDGKRQRARIEDDDVTRRTAIWDVTDEELHAMYGSAPSVDGFDDTAHPSGGGGEGKVAGGKGSLHHYIWASVLQMARFGEGDEDRKFRQERVFDCLQVFPCYESVQQQQQQQQDYYHPHNQHHQYHHYRSNSNGSGGDVGGNGNHGKLNGMCRLQRENSNSSFGLKQRNGVPCSLEDPPESKDENTESTREPHVSIF